jgi:hypothetical protein
MSRQKAKWKVRWDPRVESKFRVLIGKQGFKFIVKKFRTRTGLPLGGIKKSPQNIFPPTTTKGREGLKILQEVTAEAIKKYNLPARIFRVPIETYLCSGQFLMDPYQGLYSEFKIGKGNVSIVIYPGANRRYLADELKRWWVWAEMKNGIPEEQFRKGEENWMRNTQIAELYESGVLNFKGEIKQEAAAHYLKIPLDHKITKEDFADVGVEMPGEEMRKKIIREYRREGRI